MNTVQRLELENFTAFRRANFTFSPGINVLIGENSTGKTHILKLLYSLLQTAASEPTKKSHALDKVIAVFKPEASDFSKLVNYKAQPGEKLTILLNHVQLTLELNGQIPVKPISKIKITRGQIPLSWPPGQGQGLQKLFLYLPNREVLSINPGFIAAYLHRELSFDETYYDLCVALNASLLRDETYQEVRHLVQPLEQILVDANKITKKNDYFYIELPDAGNLQADLVAEGFRKLATLVYLIRNGSLAPGHILFWDEPEANLNPKLVKAVVDFLVELANAGVQIFLATHDYLLSYELSLRAEYNQFTDIKFFSLYRESGVDGVQVESGNSLADIVHNPILEGYVDHSEREDALFYSASPV
jgi:energy-coupling factor transporter ATP-binding protein EcfA2